MEVQTPRERMERVAAHVCKEMEGPRRLVFSKDRDSQAVRLRHGVWVALFDAGFSITAITRFTGHTYATVYKAVMKAMEARRARAREGRVRDAA